MALKSLGQDIQKMYSDGVEVKKIYSGGVEVWSSTPSKLVIYDKGYINPVAGDFMFSIANPSLTQFITFEKQATQLHATIGTPANTGNQGTVLHTNRIDLTPFNKMIVRFSASTVANSGINIALDTTTLMSIVQGRELPMTTYEFDISAIKTANSQFGGRMQSVIDPSSIATLIIEYIAFE